MPARGDYTDREEAAAENFERFIGEHRAVIARVAAAYTRTTGDGDDLFQEIAVALWQALPRFRGECSERTFVFRIAHNRAVSWLARRHVHEPLPEETADLAVNPETELVREQRSQALLRAVRKLPIPYRQVVMLALEGLDYAETAEVLGISESNVGVRMNRGRQMLRELLEKHR
jgi:RNA polymerase sigma-70 factor (ECF subfamily)